MLKSKFNSDYNNFLELIPKTFLNIDSFDRITIFKK